MDVKQLERRVLVVGAGPAGLIAAYLLSKDGIAVTVIECDPQYVGGISRTVAYKDFLFDIGGHRFFSKSREVEDLWNELLPDDILERPRSTRICYNGALFSYPLKPFEALGKLGVFVSADCLLSYFKAKLRPIPNPVNFEDWVTNQFGQRLYRIFFKTYTEKVWGMDCKDISADWAAQRIKGLSLGSAILHALFPRKPKSRDAVVKTLITSFRYPRRGPGMMWDAAARKTKELGGTILMGQKVIALDYDVPAGSWAVTCRDADGAETTHSATHVISSAPLRSLVSSLSPPVSPSSLHAANALKYRDFLTVAVILKDRGVFADNWIYIHDPSVKVGRIQNFKSWSPDLVPDPTMCCYGMEYFCFENDGLWSRSDEDLLRLAQKELVTLGLADAADFVDGCVVRQPKAYPVYDAEYAAHVETIRCELEERFPSLYLVGRNGMHKYNNQDHAMMTAMLTAANIIAGERRYDVWNVNGDAEYHEAGESGARTLSSVEKDLPGGLLLVPTTIRS